MSLTVALQNALSGLQTNEAIIQVISNNVTNANTEGYTRKVADPVSRVITGEGRGTETGELERVVDARLIADLRETMAVLGDAKAQEFYRNRILDEFGTLGSDSALGARLTDFSNALQGLATSPDSSALRSEVLTTAMALAEQLNDLSRAIQTLRYDADREIATKVQQANAELERIADLNNQIERGRALGDPTAELEDFRDQAINTLSGLLDIRYFKRTSGEIVITLPNGQVLADKIAHPLSHTPAGALSPEISYAGGGIPPILSGPRDITGSLASGEIYGLIQARDGFLPDLQTQIDQLAELLRDEINALHNAGAGLPPANTLTGTRSFAAPASNTITTSTATRIAVVDGNGDFVAHYDLAAGTYTIKQIENLITTNLTGLASASSGSNSGLSITAANGSHGIAIVDLGEQTVTGIDGTTAYSGFSNYFGLNDFFVTPGRVPGDPTTGLAAMIEVRGDIITNSARIARGRLDAGPAPAAGSPAITPGDGAIAQAMADRFLEDLQFGAGGSLSATSATLAEYASEILSTLAVATSNTERTLEFKTTLLDELSFRNSAISGVNIDEELRNMVVYENAYAATARIMQVVDDLFELLVNLGN